MISIQRWLLILDRSHIAILNHWDLAIQVELSDGYDELIERFTSPAGNLIVWTTGFVRLLRLLLLLWLLLVWLLLIKICSIIWRLYKIEILIFLYAIIILLI